MDITDFPAANCATTPLKSDDGSCMSSRSVDSDKVNLNQWKTPVRCNDTAAKRSKSKSNSFKSSVFTKMPVYSPQSNDMSYVKNPFEHGRLLKARLSQPICSPSLFEKKITPVKDNQFNWSIEDISVLRPAPINENPLQDFDTWFSPATENEAQKAINEFFSSQIVQMDSPVDRKCRVTKEVEQGTRESWSQTMLTFPPILPPEIEEILSAYHMYSDHDIDDEDEDLSYANTSVIRKKLFSPLKDCEQSLCKTPLQCNNVHLKQTVASTPLTSVLTSPEISPIPLDKVQDSPMDISVSFKSRTRLSLMDDIDSDQKGNVQRMSWSRHSVVEFSSRDSPDSAFSSV